MEINESNENKENNQTNEEKENKELQENKETDIFERKEESSSQKNKDINLNKSNENMKNEREINDNNEEKINNEEIKNNEKKESEKEKKEKKQKKKDLSLTKNINKSKSTKMKYNKKNIINKNNNNNENKIMIYYKYRKENILNYIKQKEQQEIGECSFRPKINKKIGFEINNLDNNKAEKEKENSDVVDRLMKWNERMQKKKNDSINKRAETARNGCTFNPKLNSEVPKFENTKINGTKKYLERIKNSREMQKQKEEKLNPNYDMLYNKYYKKKEKTVLNKNKKLTEKEYQNYINAIHNALMNDDD
jgi:hypothetical protein